MTLMAKTMAFYDDVLCTTTMISMGEDSMQKTHKSTMPALLPPASALAAERSQYGSRK